MWWHDPQGHCSTDGSCLSTLTPVQDLSYRSMIEYCSHPGHGDTEAEAKSSAPNVKPEPGSEPKSVIKITPSRWPS